jgi:hypothetical protein
MRSMSFTIGHTALLFSFFCILWMDSPAASDDLYPVKIAFIEALAPRDSTSSDRFQKDYELAIESAKRLTKVRLARCGYRLETITSFYDASDPVQAKERGAQAAADGAWLLVGPRRSNHYLLLAQGALKTPTVSIMATASEVEKLGDLHLSVSATNSTMAEVAVLEAKRRTKAGSRTYVSLVSADCLACKDFAVFFDSHAKKIGISKLGDFQVIGDAPDVSTLIPRLKSLAPSFILLPNYSKVSSFLISAIRASGLESFFVGGDGWGDSNFGFLQNNPQVAGARGFAVRGLPPLELGLRQFSLGRELLRAPNKNESPFSGPALAILKTIDSIGELLCSTRPISTESFARNFRMKGRKLLRAPWGVSVFSLSGTRLTFDSIAEVK